MQHGKYCDECGKWYEYERVTSQFCSDECRVKSYRRNRRKNPKNEAYSIIARLVDRGLQEIDFSDEPEEILNEMRKFRDRYWNNS